MDVLAAYASKVHPDGENECAVKLLEHLGAKRKNYAKKLHASAHQYGPAVRGRLKRASTRIDKTFRRATKPPANGKAPGAEVAASVLTLSTEFATPKRLRRANLHPYRLMVKELRNLLQMADKTQPDLIDHLGETKDAIGEWHDWEELISVATKALDHAPRCRLIAELKRISNEKYEHALTVTERLRSKYFQPSKARGKRSSAARIHQPAKTGDSCHRVIGGLAVQGDSR